ncbi:MAG: hypothetical protein JF628_07395 [Sphingomonas sp.]|nr:hypothetical protein [Sphingomonas sp.]
MISLLILAAAAAPEIVGCSLDEVPVAHCTMTDTVAHDGSHRLLFQAGTRRILFAGRSQTGWWSGTLNGRPAMGYERNRGNVVFSTTDLKQSFAWWYPRDEHGTY